MGYRVKQRTLFRRISNGWETLKCSSSSPVAIREMENKITLRFHLIFITLRWIKLLIQVTVHSAIDVNQGEHFSIAGGNTNLINTIDSQ